MFMFSRASGTISSRPVAMNRKKMAASRRRHPFLCLQFTQDFIGSPKHYAAQDVRKRGQAPGNGVGQQAQHHKEHGDAQHEQGGRVIALDEPREQGAEQAEPAQGLQECPGHSSRQPDHGGKDNAGDGKGEHDDPQQKTHGENLLKSFVFSVVFPLYVYYNSAKTGCKGCLRLARVGDKVSQTRASRGAAHRSPAFTFPPPGSAFSAARTGVPTNRHSPFAAGRCPGGRRRRRCWPGSPPD